jgi:hypothetical protein
MSASGRMGDVSKLALLIVLCCLGIAARGHAEPGEFTVIASLGGAYLPMGDWKEFAGATGHYHTDALGRTREVAVQYELSNRFAFAISAGLVTTSATNTEYMYFTSTTGESIDSTALYAAWDFKGYPVGLSMEFYPGTGKGPVNTSLGVGSSYYFSEVDGRVDLMPDMGLQDDGSVKARRGSGYGFHAYVSVRARLGHGVVVSSRLRAQYADGMAFTEPKGSVPVRFSGVDVSLGLGWSPCGCWGR